MTVVDVGEYRGMVGTMWWVVREEGSTSTPVSSSPAAIAGAVRNAAAPGVKVRKGQGVQGLWRGWRVGFWGLVGVWGAAALGQGGGGEF